MNDTDTNDPGALNRKQSFRALRERGKLLNQDSEEKRNTNSYNAIVSRFI